MKHIQNEKIVEILWKYLREESLTAGEKDILGVWLSESAHNQKIFDEVTDENNLNKEIEFLLKKDTGSIWDRIAPAIMEEKRVPARIGRPWFKYVAAAIVVVSTLSAGFYFWQQQKGQKVSAGTTATMALQGGKNDIAPGGNKASLTLADGTVIVLDAAANGTLSQQGNTKINKLQDGELAYEASNLLIGDQIPLTFNTLSTPRGGQYQVNLPDGSKVWLNAASSLRYPVSFSKKERIVELTGEAYFEIASVKPSSTEKSAAGRSARVPFLVKVNDMNVEVLGTHFNVAAYKDEKYIKTTLLEGSVKVSQGGDRRLLKPGQQVEVANQDLFPVRPFRKMHVISNADTDEAVSWKKGYFYFKSIQIENIMNQISRWYNVDIIYQSTKPQGNYSGKINRNTNLSEVLNMLEVSGIRTRINGNKIVVLP